MSENYSPLRYPGGKSKLSTFLIKAMHENGLTCPFYVEPYAGGAGAALRLLFEEYVEDITINDADPRIRAFWDAVTQQTSRFIDRIQEIPLTVAEFTKQRELYSKASRRRTFDLGFATFYLNRTTRSGIIHNGGPIGGYDQTGNYKIVARFNRYDLARRIQRIGAYADRINVSGYDGLFLLRKLNQRICARDTFVYIDPPYYAKGNELYWNQFVHEEHAKLASFLSSPKNFTWLLTYDDVERIRDLYPSHSQIQFSLTYSAHRRKVGSELLIHSSRLSVPDRILTFLPTVAA